MNSLMKEKEEGLEFAASAGGGTTADLLLWGQEKSETGRSHMLW